MAAELCEASLRHTPAEQYPWYPTVRLFRRRESRDYAGVIDM
jgi:hypothetical protein